MAKLAVTPPVVGSVRSEMKGSRSSARRLSAAEVLAICMSERIPSCIRAPPEAETMSRGMPLLDGQLDGPGDLFAHHRRHAAPEERELEDGEGDGVAADAPHPGEHRLLEAGLAARRLDAIRVSLGVLEAERILGGEPGLALLEGALVHDGGDALARADPERIAALRAHAPGPVDLGTVHDLLAGVALDPETFRDVDLLGPILAVPFPVALPEPRGHALGHRCRAGETEGCLERGDEVAHPRHELREPACFSTSWTMADPTMTPSAA